MKILIGGPVGVLVVDLRDGFKTSLTGAHVFLAAQTLLQAPLPQTSLCRLGQAADLILSS